MTESFYSLGLSREQLADLHRAILAQYIIEETFRREHGEESQDPPALLAHVERLLELDKDQSHVLFHEEEDRLWEYSWYAYTDEWAWYRARQDVEREAGEDVARLNPEQLETLIEKTYDKEFDRYTHEIDMAGPVNSTAPKNTHSRRAKK